MHTYNAIYKHWLESSLPHKRQSSWSSERKGVRDQQHPDRNPKTVLERKHSLGDLAPKSYSREQVLPPPFSLGLSQCSQIDLVERYHSIHWCETQSAFEAGRATQGSKIISEQLCIQGNTKSWLLFALGLGNPEHSKLTWEHQVSLLERPCRCFNFSKHHPLSPQLHLAHARDRHPRSSSKSGKENRWVYMSFGTSTAAPWISRVNCVGPLTYGVSAIHCGIINAFSFLGFF